MRFTSLFLVIVVLLTLAFTAAAQEAHTVFRHGGSVQTVAYSPGNPALFASAGDTGAVKLWNLQDDTVTTLGSHANTVNALAFSPNGRWLVSGSDDYTFKAWDVSQRIEIRSLQHISDWTRSPIKAVAFSPDGRQLATAGVHVKLWDTLGWSEITTLQHDEWLWAVAFSSDSTLLATGDHRGQINVWNLRNQRAVTQLHVGSNSVYTVQFSPNDQILARAGYEGKVKLWTVPNWKPYGTLTSNSTISDISFSPDSSMLTGIGYEFVNLWKVDSNEPTSIQMLTPSAYLPNARNFTLQFEVSDADGIHQAQLLVPVTPLDPAPGVKLHSCKDLHTQRSTLEFRVPTLTARQINNVVLQVIDVYGNITRQDYTLKANAALLPQNHVDVNRDGIAAPEQLLATIAIPTETRIFANYPNPFNPETWIPYQLSDPAEVTLHISSVDGTLVRTLALGHRAAGTFHSKSRAAYWDGRNEHGERVASGVYFYTLSTGDFTATRKMFIRK